MELIKFRYKILRYPAGNALHSCPCWRYVQLEWTNLPQTTKDSYLPPYADKWKTQEETVQLQILLPCNRVYWCNRVHFINTHARNWAIKQKNYMKSFLPIKLLIVEYTCLPLWQFYVKYKSKRKIIVNSWTTTMKANTITLNRNTLAVGNRQSFLLVIFFFYSPRKVCGGCVHVSQGKYPIPSPRPLMATPVLQ